MWFDLALAILDERNTRHFGVHDGDTIAICSDETIASAASRMSEFEVRHLPVVEGGKLCGIISDRDIKFVESFSDVDAKQLTVRAAMNEHPYAVAPDAGLDEVAATMARRKARLCGDRTRRTGDGHLHYGRRLPSAVRALR